jgi:hypothetical protein
VLDRIVEHALEKGRPRSAVGVYWGLIGAATPTRVRVVGGAPSGWSA